MTEASVSFAGNLTEDPELRHTEAGIARAMFRVAVSGRREQEASFFTVIAWRDQAKHAAESLTKGSRVVVVGRLRQRSWTTEDGSAPIHGRGAGRGAGTEPALGDRHAGQGHQERHLGGSCGHSGRRPRQPQEAEDLPSRSGPVGFHGRGARGTGCRQVHRGAASGGVSVRITRAWRSQPPRP